MAMKNDLVNICNCYLIYKIIFVRIHESAHTFPVFLFFSLVPEEKFLTLEGFHRFSVDRAKQDVRSVWRAILACGYDLHFER